MWLAWKLRGELWTAGDTFRRSKIAPHFWNLFWATRIVVVKQQVSDKWDEQVLQIGETVPMKKPTQHLIAEVPRSSSKVEMTIGIDLGDVWSHCCTLNQDGEVVDRRRFRTTPASVDKLFTDLPRTRIAMEAGAHSIWISEQLQELGHEVLVANVRELRAISHSDRKSDQADAEKLARFARMDPKILRPISHRTIAQQEALTLIRARNLLVRLRTAAVNAVRVSRSLAAIACPLPPRCVLRSGA